MNEVESWLQSLSLPQYFQAFQYHKFDTLKKCSKLTVADLDNIGVHPLGHKKRILGRLPHVGEGQKEIKAAPVKPPRTSLTKKTTKLCTKTDMNTSVPLPPPTPCGAARNLNYANDDEGVTYDVPPPSNRVSTQSVEDEDIYQNYDNPVLKSDHQKESHKKEPPPPALPQKTKKNDAHSSNLPLSSGPALPSPQLPHNSHPSEATQQQLNKRPVPKPRTSLMKKQQKPSGNHPKPVNATHTFPLAGVTIDESTDEDPVDNEAASSTPEPDIYSAPKPQPSPTTPTDDSGAAIYEVIKEGSPPLYDAVYEPHGNLARPPSPPELPPLPARHTSVLSNDYEGYDPEVPSSLDTPVLSSDSPADGQKSTVGGHYYDQPLDVRRSGRSSMASTRASLQRSSAIEQVSTELPDDELNQLVHLPAPKQSPERTENYYGDDPTDNAVFNPPAIPQPLSTRSEARERTSTPPVPPHISERVVMGAEMPDEEIENQNNEFLEKKSHAPHKDETSDTSNNDIPLYDSAMDVGTTPALISFDDDDQPYVDPLIKHPNKPPNPAGNSSRHVTILPPPPFAPPPLPPGIVRENDKPPPVIPPRPKPHKVEIPSPKTTPSNSSSSNTSKERFSRLDPFGSLQRSFSHDDPFAKPDPFESSGSSSQDLEVSTPPKLRHSISVQNPRNTMAEFEEFSRLRAEQGGHATSTPQDAGAAANHSVDSNDDMCAAARDQCSGSPTYSVSKRLSEDNIYGPSPIPRQDSESPSGSPTCLYARATRKAPKPPPKTDNPFKSMYDKKRGTYDLGDDFMNSSFEASATVWESDDTLSDGGDFYEEQDIPLPKTTLPIIPAVQHKVSERSGYLYKQASKRSSRINVWTKRFVQFDNGEFRYFSSSKSKVSKRIIPAVTMLNIRQDIRTNENHPYRFTIVTIDRCYTFALDESDDMTMWTSVLMQAILENESLADDFVEGGNMNQPDKEGFVRMDGIRGKRYLAIKKDKFCYYNTYNDYKVDSPIHRIDMQLGSVKDLNKGNKLQLNTPYGSYAFMFDSQVELTEWKNAFEESIAEGLGDDEILDKVYANHSNKYCADCGAPNPTWASVNFCVTLCKMCAGIHRTLTVPQSKIRSLRMDFKVWTPELQQLMNTIGNDNANNFWEWHASEDDKIDSDADLPSRKDFILNKYERKKYCRWHPLTEDQDALDEALCKNMSFDDVLETMQLLFSGAYILHSSSAYSVGNETPFKIASRSNQPMQKEFLYQNGGECAERFHTSGSSFRAPTKDIEDVSMRGFLLKTGSNPKGDFLRRWVVLDHGVLSYYDNEKSSVAKDTIEKKEMLSVTKTADERNEYSFEIGTTKHGCRVYLFAADSCEERNKWIVALSKVMAGLKQDSGDKIKDFDKGGVLFQRSGATKEWKLSWVHTKYKTLFIYDKDADNFEELDLRKANSINQLQQAERCLQAFDEGQPFVVDFPHRPLYLQGDTRRETESWYKSLYEALMNVNPILEDQQLTTDDIPVAVDKCINFISLHGMEGEGLYRLNGQHSKVTKLLELFNIDARGVNLDLTEYTINDVATTLKRFLRSLEDPLLTKTLYERWIKTSVMPDPGVKIEWYKYLLGELPKVHYNTIQKIVVHLARVAQLESKNRMGILNLASIFGPVSLNPEKDNQTSAGYGTTNQEISVLKDLLENYNTLFEVNDEKENKIEKARKKLLELQKKAESQENLDMQLWIHVLTEDEPKEIPRKISSQTLAEEVISGVCKAAKLNEHIKWGLFEQICNEELERPIHYRENVFDITKKWGSLPAEFSKGSRLVLKQNRVYENIELIFQPNNALFSELKYTEEKKKSYKKVYFQFGQYKLSFRKDTKAASPSVSWNVEDLLVYIGVQKKRNPPTGYGFSFIKNTDTPSVPFFGHSVCCNNKEELYRWIGAILCAQHPGGLEAGGRAAGAHPSAHPSRPAPPPPDSADAAHRLRRDAPSKSSISKIKGMFSKR